MRRGSTPAWPRTSASIARMKPTSSIPAELRPPSFNCRRARRGRGRCPRAPVAARRCRGELPRSPPAAAMERDSTGQRPRTGQAAGTVSPGRVRRRPGLPGRLLLGHRGQGGEEEGDHRLRHPSVSTVKLMLRMRQLPSTLAMSNRSTPQWEKRLRGGSWIPSRPWRGCRGCACGREIVTPPFLEPHPVEVAIIAAVRTQPPVCRRCGDRRVMRFRGPPGPSGLAVATSAARVCSAGGGVARWRIQSHSSKKPRTGRETRALGAASTRRSRRSGERRAVTREETKLAGSALFWGVAPRWGIGGRADHILNMPKRARSGIGAFRVRRRRGRARRGSGPGR